MPSKKVPKTGGIYRIWFGQKYYIGRTRSLKTRIKSHRSDLNARLAGTYKDPLYDPALDMYQKVMKHLKTIKDTNLFMVEVLIYCDEDEHLVLNEQKWFDKVKNDPNCLNLGFEAKPYKDPRTDNFKYEPFELRPDMLAKKKIRKEKKAIKTKEKREKQKEIKKRKENPYLLLKTSAEKIAYLKAVLDRLGA